MKDQAIEWSKHLKQQEEAMYAKYKVLARNLLERKNAQDLIPMLGLDEDQTNG